MPQAVQLQEDGMALRQLADQNRCYLRIQLLTLYRVPAQVDLFLKQPQ